MERKLCSIPAKVEDSNLPIAMNEWIEELDVSLNSFLSSSSFDLRNVAARNLDRLKTAIQSIDVFAVKSLVSSQQLRLFVEILVAVLRQVSQLRGLLAERSLHTSSSPLDIKKSPAFDFDQTCDDVGENVSTLPGLCIDEAATTFQMQSFRSDRSLSNNNESPVGPTTRKKKIDFVKLSSTETEQERMSRPERNSAEEKAQTSSSSRSTFSCLTLESGWNPDDDDALKEELRLIGSAAGDGVDLREWQRSLGARGRPAKVQIEKRGGGKKSVACALCRRKKPFRSAQFKEFAFHVLTVHGEKKHECPVCRKRFTRAAYVKTHVSAMHDGGGVLCPVCGQKFLTKWTMELHRRKAHERVKHVCHVCGRDFLNKVSLKNHVIKDHEGRYNHRCEDCGKGFMRSSALEHHVMFRHRGIRTKHLVKEACPYCGKLYTPKALKNHLKEHEGGLLECQVVDCGKTFASDHNLALHVKTVHDKIRVECPECDRTFSNGTLLRNHRQSVHEGVRWSCDACGKQLKTRALLLNHKKQIHAKIRHQCLQCQQSFSQKHSLNYHVRLKHGTEERFKCRNCDKRFVIPWKMREHSRRCDAQMGKKCDDDKDAGANCAVADVTNATPQTDASTPGSGVLDRVESGARFSAQSIQSRSVAPCRTEALPISVLPPQISFVNSVQDILGQTSARINLGQFTGRSPNDQDQLTFLAIIPS